MTEQPPPWMEPGVDYSGDPWFITPDAHTEYGEPVVPEPEVQAFERLEERPEPEPASEPVPVIEAPPAQDLTEADWIALGFERPVEG